MINKIKKAFTLAEILIVLGIIGIVADMTIPTLISKSNERITVTKLKKSYSILSQAYAMATLENETPENWGMTAGIEEHEYQEDTPEEKSNSPEIALSYISPYLKIIKNCGQKPGCFPEKYKYLDGTPAKVDSSKTSAKAQLADGTLLLIDVHSPTCNMNYGDTDALQSVCGSINIDTNGPNPPNQFGKDIFIFWYTKHGIIPLGLEADKADGFEMQCSDKTSGFGCAAWVIYNENLDYLHCEGLSWDGKKSCE